jgi:hypothetical protein
MSTSIVAEVKTHSPFGWVSSYSWDELFEIANSVGDIISIHTDPRWHGSFDLVKKARALTDKPILAKGIHAHDKDIEEALAAGADYVLVVGRLPKIYQDKLWMEPNTLDDLKALPHHIKAVWNSRDLNNGKSKDVSFAEARAVFPGWLCQASFITTNTDIDPAANAAIIGTSLPEFSNQR